MTAFGANALASATSATGCTAFGYAAGQFATGSDNIFVGANSGSALIAGNNNILLDSPGSPNDNNTIRIGGVQTKAFITGIRGITTVVNDAVAVFINSSGQLGILPSSRGYKKNIRPINDIALNTELESSSTIDTNQKILPTIPSILDLTPIKFIYKTPDEISDVSDVSDFSDDTKYAAPPLDVDIGTINYGFIASDVAKVLPVLAIKGVSEDVGDNTNVPSDKYVSIQHAFMQALLVAQLQKHDAIIAELA
jgi:hypothetical protein